MKKIKYLFALTAISLAFVACKKDENEANFVENDGNRSKPVIASSTDLGVSDVFFNDGVETNYLRNIVSIVTDGGVSVTVQFASTDTSKIETGSYLYVDNNDTVSANTQQNAVYEAFLLNASGTQTSVKSGSATINSISESSIDFRFDFITTDDKALKGKFSGELTN